MNDLDNLNVSSSLLLVHCNGHLDFDFDWTFVC